jgi:hypothetical protein
MIITIVGGTFDHMGGKPSGYIRRFVEELRSYTVAGDTVRVHNGGHFDDLYDNRITNTDVLLWFPNVDNSQAKLVNTLKVQNPKMMLVISKNNMQHKYDRLQVVARALQAKANLLVEFTSIGRHIAGTIIDPLGSVFCDTSTDIEDVVMVLVDRIQELMSFTRIPSKRVGESLPVAADEEFLKIVREYADEFHTIIHAVNQGRLLGNVSFRCENGFPSYRVDDVICVSRRNIDKRDINSLGFVAVNVTSTDVVEYYGDAKPSVDTPIQVRLYEYYTNVKYMLHAHVSIAGAPVTRNIVPCGAVEEFDDIIALYPDRTSTNFAVNLRGHGSLVLTSTVEDMKNIRFVRRL